MSKTCTQCLKDLPIEDFPRNGGKPDGRSSWCKPCHAEKSRRWREANPEKARQTRQRYEAKNPDKHHQSHLSRTYGITVDEFESILGDQGGGCAICGTDQPSMGKRLCVDHVEGTRLIRGVLCSRCNSAIGLLDHDAERLRACIDYLVVPPAYVGRESGRRGRHLDPKHDIRQVADGNF